MNLRDFAVNLKKRVGVSATFAIDSNGRTIWIADAHRDDGKRFVVRADQKLTAFPEFESAIRKNCLDAIGGRLTQPEKTKPPSAFA